MFYFTFVLHSQNCIQHFSIFLTKICNRFCLFWRGQTIHNQNLIHKAKKTKENAFSNRHSTLLTMIIRAEEQQTEIKVKNETRMNEIKGTIKNGAPLQSRYCFLQVKR